MFLTQFQATTLELRSSVLNIVALLSSSFRLSFSSYLLYSFRRPLMWNARGIFKRFPHRENNTHISHAVDEYAVSTSCTVFSHGSSDVWHWWWHLHTSIDFIIGPFFIYILHTYVFANSWHELDMHLCTCTCYSLKIKNDSTIQKNSRSRRQNIICVGWILYTSFPWMRVGIF